MATEDWFGGRIAPAPCVGARLVRLACAVGFGAFMIALPLRADTARKLELYLQTRLHLSTTALKKSSGIRWLLPRAELMRMAGRIRMRQWLAYQPATEAKAVLNAKPALQKLHLWGKIFSPAVRQRVKAAAALAKFRNRRAAGILLDGLLLDPSKQVRRRVMRIFHQMRPNATGTRELFWLAIETESHTAMTFSAASRGWAPFPPVRKVTKFIEDGSIDGVKITLHARNGKRYYFSEADRRRAADVLIRYPSETVEALVLAELRHDSERALPEPPLHPAPAIGLPRSVHSRSLCRWELIRIVRSWKAAQIAHLMKMVLSERAGKSQSFAWEGRPYFYNRQTDGIGLALSAIRQRPENFGIALAAGRAPGLRQWGAFSERDQQAARRYLRTWLGRHSAGATEPTGRSTPRTEALRHFFFGQIARSNRMPDVNALEMGLIRFLAWAETLPPEEAAVEMRWGCRANHIEAVGECFRDQMHAAEVGLRLIASSSSRPMQLITAHLILQGNAALRRAAIRRAAKLTGKLDAAVESALWKLATSVSRRSPRTVVPGAQSATLVLMKRAPGHLEKCLTEICRDYAISHSGLLQKIAESPYRHLHVLRFLSYMFTHLKITAQLRKWMLRAVTVKGNVAVPQWPLERFGYNGHIGGRTVLLYALCKIGKLSPANYGLELCTWIPASGDFQWMAQSRAAEGAACARILKTLTRQ